MPEIVIKQARLDDLADLYFVTLKTGNSGSDATALYRNDQMLGEVFVGPYVTHASETSNLLSQSGKTVGYGVCVLDTELFQNICKKNWWPKLQVKYAELKHTIEDDWLVREIFFPTLSPTEILIDFPSHGHIDLLPEIQGKGWGRKMMAQMEKQLQELGSPGFHLRVSSYNERGLQFYAALGYTKLLQVGDEVVVGKRFSK